MTNPGLPDDILTKVETDFAASEREVVTHALARLLEVTREPERVARCVLFVAGGELAEFDQMIELARTDYRDAIVAAEYDQTDRRLRDLSKPFEDSELRP